MPWALFIFFFPLASSSVNWGRDGGRRDEVGGPNCMVAVWSFLKDLDATETWSRSNELYSFEEKLYGSYYKDDVDRLFGKETAPF
jgi:hypothetical protein